MPIHSSILNPRQAEAGKIKIGGLGDKRKAKSGRNYQLPVKHDYFTVTKTTRNSTGNFEPDTKIMELLPKDREGKIREIPILLDSDKIEEVFLTTLACYHGRNLYCHGDGKNAATRYQIRKEQRDGGTVLIRTGQTKEVDCTCELLNATEGLQCRPHGTLWCTIQAGEETRIGARHSFRTTSWYTIRAIASGLATIQQIVGTIAGIPLWLCFRQRLVTPRGSAGAKKIPVVHIECRSKDILALQRHAIERAKTRHVVARVAGRPVELGLPPPAALTETPEDQAQLQQEYHPDPPEDDEDDYDPETGEVYDTDAVDPPSPEPTNQAPLEADAVLPPDHEIRRELQKLLTEVAMYRDFSDDDLAKGRVAIWQEACNAADLPMLPWDQLTTERAETIGPKLQAMLPREEDQ